MAVRAVCDLLSQYEFIHNDQNVHHHQGNWGPGEIGREGGKEDKNGSYLI